MSNRNETFGRLLKGAINSVATYEGKTAVIIEEELAEKVGLAGSAFQRYKSGYLPPEPRTIEIIAEAAVRRGFLSREWLQRFLHAARYHQAEKLLDNLCPIGSARPRPPRVYQNLPAPTYSQFVMRQEAFDEVLDGLSKRSAAVIIAGLGGNGKTSLAREIADSCLKDDDGQALFDAAVWVSDKDRPGTTNLSIVLDEISRTLDYPGFTQFDYDEKRREVEQLLRRQRVLVCIDNFETITDGALLSWLLNLPEPSKALITTREYRREYRRGGWPVELHGMMETEAWKLITERVQVLKIERLISERTHLEPLLAATGGNPKALTMTLGLLKYERRPLQELVKDLYAARGDIFDDLFTRAWELLDEPARRVLLVAAFFPTSVSGEGLGAIADVQGLAFDRTVERLADLALLDVQQADLRSLPRYVLHPLVRSFAGAKLTEQPAFEVGARARWIAWYCRFVEQISSRWYETYALAQIDPEAENLLSATVWAFENDHLGEGVVLSGTMGYYYYVRGFWDRQLRINEARLVASRKLDDRQAEAFTILSILRVLVQQGQLSEANKLTVRLNDLMRDATLLNQHRMSFLHGLAIVAFANRNTGEGRAMLEQVMELSQEADVFKYNRARNWLADSYLQEGQLEEAERLFTTSLVASLRIRYHRSITYCQVKLAIIALTRQEFDLAEQLLEESSSRATAIRDRRDLALILKTYARLHILRDDLPAARTFYSDAIDLFERLGMRRELAEAREELRRLEEMGEAPAA